MPIFSYNIWYLTKNFSVSENFITNLFKISLKEFLFLVIQIWAWISRADVLSSCYPMYVLCAQIYVGTLKEIIMQSPLPKDIFAIKGCSAIEVFILKSISPLKPPQICQFQTTCLQKDIKMNEQSEWKENIIPYWWSIIISASVCSYLYGCICFLVHVYVHVMCVFVSICAWIYIIL